MFDENFSFLSSTSNTNVFAYADCTSSDVSPFTSRSSSPGPHFRHSSISARSTQDRPRRDSRYNSITSMPSSAFITSMPSTASIAALTTQLEQHALSAEAANFSPSPTATTPSYSDFSDEGFVDGPLSSASDLGDDHTLWDLTTSDYSVNSSSNAAFGPNNFPSFALRRRQRQALVRLQCLAQRAPDLMMLAEECHPSSMALPEEPVWSSGAKRQHSLSTSNALAGRVEKERGGGVSVKRTPKMRKRNTR